MSVISLLSTHSCADLKSLWQTFSLEQYGITFSEGCSAQSASGQLIFHGVSFTYEIEGRDFLQPDREIFCSLDISLVRSSIKLGFGLSVAGGARVPAVARALMQMGVALGNLSHTKAILWSPASVVSGFDYYAEAIAQYVDGAAFPALVCVAFDTSDPEIVKTRGLSWFCGQELVFRHAPRPTSEAMRYVVRLVHDLATQGAVDNEIDVAGMHDGEIIRLTPMAGNELLSGCVLKH